MSSKWWFAIPLKGSLVLFYYEIGISPSKKTRCLKSYQIGKKKKLSN